MTRPPTHSRRALLVALLLLSSCTSLLAQGTATVPLDDPAYRYLDRLEELGVVRSAIMGQRPHSYAEVGRLLREARRNAGIGTSGGEHVAVVDPLVAALIARLSARLERGASPTSALIDEGVLAIDAINTLRRRVRLIDSGAATIDPLALRRLGDPAVRGQSLALELLQSAEPATWLAVNARERIQASKPSDAGVASHDAAVLEAGARARWRNLALMVGREQLGWGSGSRGGLFIAADAPALDQVVVASEHPFLLPGVLHRAGPVAGTLTLAEMGPSTVRSHSMMLAYKVSVRPAPTLELGATFQNHFGGEGGRPSPFLTRVIDFLPMIDIFRRHNYTDSTQVLDVDSDKALGADIRWRIDRLGGVIVAGEWLVDDFDVHRLVSLLNYAGSHALSVTLPRLASQAWSLELLATHMGPLTYTHATLTQGMTTRGRLLGSELGPDVKRFGAELRWTPTAATQVALAGQAAIFSNAEYPAGYDAAGHWVVRRLSLGPDELREQVVASLTLEPAAATALTVRGGVERIRNVMFVDGRRHGYVADVALRWRP